MVVTLQEKLLNETSNDDLQLNSVSFHLFILATKCYQCGYTPGKLVVRQEKVTVTVRDPYNPHKSQKKIVTRLVSERKPGGWEPCKGPFTKRQAYRYGMDVWDCDGNCYTRTDSNESMY